MASEDMNYEMEDEAAADGGIYIVPNAAQIAAVHSSLRVSLGSHSAETNAVPMDAPDASVANYTPQEIVPGITVETLVAAYSAEAENLKAMEREREKANEQKLQLVLSGKAKATSSKASLEAAKEAAFEASRPPVKCNEKDVLLGRGKRISEWPGNIAFRMIVNKYRPDYISSIRTEKVYIAQKVIAEAKESGSRFLRELNPSNVRCRDAVWLEISDSRALEKTCQALREKEKPYTKAPHVNSISLHIDEKPLTLDMLAASKRHVTPFADDVLDKKRLTDDPFEALKTAMGQKAENKLVFRPPDMLNKLQEFGKTYGHLAVPPGWPPNVAFADWCSTQRQLHREVACGYREPYDENKTEPVEEEEEEDKAEEAVVEAVVEAAAVEVIVEEAVEAAAVEAVEAVVEAAEDSTAEEGTVVLAEPSTVTAADLAPLTLYQHLILKTLTEMGFCWDYEEWHWNHSFKTYMDEDSESSAMCLWLRVQRQRYREGQLQSERYKKLQEAGVLFV